MDNVECLPDVQRSEPDSEDLPPRPSSVEAGPEDLHELRIRSLDQIQDLLRKYAEMPVPKEHVLLFHAYLQYRRDCWFIEVGDIGLLYLTDVVPELSARFHVAFWDGKYKESRREIIKTVLTEAFEIFDLQRIGCVTAVENFDLKVMLRKIGFVIEGVIRKGWVEPPNRITDAVLFGLLREEARWPEVLRATTISSA